MEPKNANQPANWIFSHSLKSKATLVSLLVFVISILCSAIIWQFINSQQTKLLKNAIDAEATIISNEISSEMNARITSMTRKASRWTGSDDAARIKWEKDAAEFTKLPGYQAIEWVDTTNRARWIVPLKGNEKAQDMDLTFEPKRAKALKQAKETGEEYYSGVVDLVQGPKGMLVFFPLEFNGNFDGFLVTVFNMHELLAYTLRDEITKDYQIEIFEDKQPIFIKNSSNVDLPKWNHARTIKLKDKLWILKIQPNPKLVSDYSHIKMLIAVILISISFILALSSKLLYQRHQEVIDNEKRMSAIINNTNDGLITIDDRGIIERFNPGAEKIFGYKREEVVGKNVSMLMPEPDRSTHDEYLENYEKTGKKNIIGTGREVTGLRKDGKTFPLELAVNEIKIDGIKLYSGIIRDISERKAYESQILETKNFQEVIMNNIPDVVFVKDEKFRIVQANSAFLNLYPENERKSVIGKTTLEKYNPEEAEEFLKFDKLAFKNGSSETEETIHFPDGVKRTLLTKKVRFQNDDGQTFILGVGRDITDIKKIQNELKNQKDMLELAEEIASLGHWHINLINNQLYWSEEIYRIHGVHKEEYTPEVETAIEFYHPDDRKLVQEFIETAIENQTSFTFELRLINKNGNLIYVQSAGEPEINSKGKIIGIFGVFQDITERKKSEVELIRSNQELDDFAYIASHDLKEPLRGIHNHTNLLKMDYQEKFDEDANYRIDRVLYLSQRLEKLISDLMMYSRLGRSEEKIASVNLNEMVQDIISILPEDENQAVGIRGTLPTIRCDKTHLPELFRNLIMNGLKYNESKKKHVVISARLRKTSDIKSELVYAVKDNGIGINEKFHDDIFKIFKRLHKKDAYGGGTGSGLTFVKKIIDRHEGRIWIESTPEKGTTFFFTLPNAKIENQ